MMIPAKLRPGDELRVVSPSSSMGILSPEVITFASQRLESLGLKVTFGRNASLRDEFDSSPVEARLQDIHQAFADPQVRGILTSIGGYNCNQLLNRLDYELVRRNPKILCGYSDITALSCAIYTRCDLVTYSGPHFSTFGMLHGLEETLRGFQRCLMEPGPFTLHPAKMWSDDGWYRDQENRTFLPSSGWHPIHPGRARGVLLGGNLCTLNLLQGTPYMPSLSGALLLLEDDYESKPLTFDRDLQSLLHQPSSVGVQGMLIGRFQVASGMSLSALGNLVNAKPELADLPLAAHADFGHTTPQFTFPIGGEGILSVSHTGAKLEILEH